MFRLTKQIGAKICSIRIIPNYRAKSSCADTADFDDYYEAYFNRTNIDGWECRKAMNDLAGMDLVPEPRIITAALKACRRLNDYAMAVRWLEACKDKCGSQKNIIWPYLLQEIRPTLDELGIEIPEELGYDKPELALKTVFELEDEIRRRGKCCPQKC